MYKALIIDDERPVHAAITALGNFREFHIQAPFSAYHGKDGLSAMRELRPDIVFLDMNMPVMNGISFLKVASEEFPESRIIVISGYDDFNYAHAAIKGGAIEYLLKPIDEAELNQAILMAVESLNQQNGLDSGSDEIIQEISPGEIIDDIKDYVDKNYCEEIKISMFSEKYFVSKEYLSKLFKKKHGCGIYEYALNLRMSRAKELLLDPKLQIQQIAERLGYSNSNYFSKAFKNFYNLSPSEFREMNQIKTEDA